MNRQAEDAIVRARTLLLLEQPFWGCLALNLVLVEITNPSIANTMAVDGKHLYYYAPFVLKLSVDELKGVVAHEVEHCAYKHMTRRMGRDPYKWNVAGDFVINLDLIEAGFKLPGQPISLSSKPGTVGYLYDTQFKGMSTDEVYERLPDPPTVKITILLQGGGERGDGKEAGGNGQGDSRLRPGQAGICTDLGCGSVIDAAEAGDPLKADAVDREWEAAVRAAVAQATRMAGRIPAYARRLVEALNKPQINWKDQTARWIDGNMTKDYAWHRPNRRFAHQGLILPGFVPDCIHHLVGLGDVSGSVNEKITQSFVSEMGGAMDQGTADRLTFVYFDTEVKQVDEWLPGDLISCDTKGGGGTDFRPAFKWVTENAPDATCIVCLTDMEPITWAIDDPGIPVLWGAYCTDQELARIVLPFGDVIHIDHA